MLHRYTGDANMKSAARMLVMSAVAMTESLADGRRRSCADCYEMLADCSVRNFTYWYNVCVTRISDIPKIVPASSTAAFMLLMLTACFY